MVSMAKSISPLRTVFLRLVEEYSKRYNVNVDSAQCLAYLTKYFSDQVLPDIATLMCTIVF